MGKLVVTPEMLAKLRDLLENTNMPIEGISTELGMSKSAVHDRAAQMGISTKERRKRIRAEKISRDKDRLQNPYSKIPDSMTGDGMSLEWLSKRW